MQRDGAVMNALEFKVDVERKKSIQRFKKVLDLMDGLQEDSSSQLYIDQVSRAKQELRLALEMLNDQYMDLLEEESHE